jgi:carboxypeptidase family protein/TonB-dependent receptor-like protein
MGLRTRMVMTLVLMLCLLLLVTSASGQTSTTGAIEGIVTDSNGAIVPAVTVAVTSPNLIREQSATTDNEGRYRILNLPPGRYSITVEAAGGFAKFARVGVEVNLSKTSRVAIQLEPAGATATVIVNSSSGAVVDTTNNTTGTNVSTEQFSNFTTQRTVQSLYTIAPTAARSGLRDPSGRDRDPSVGGSSGLENAYIFDGVNTSDPAFGGSGANLPFEFVQEVEIKTGAYGAEYGLSTGGIFNVLTKSGGNDLHGDAFAYFTTRGLVRGTKNFPFTRSAPNGFSELDAGFDLGGAFKKDKLWFFGAFNPQRRENSYLTQTLHQPVSNKITTPFYAGKLTYALNQRNTLTFSTFGDFTKVVGFRVAVARAGDTVMSGFGADPNSFVSKVQLLGGNNYAIRLNSTITPKWIGEFAFGAHFQRSNSGPLASMLNMEGVIDNFAILRSGAVLPVTDTDVDFGGGTGFLAFVDGRGGSLEADFVRRGYVGFVINQDRDRYEAQARLQNIFGRHTLKYGFEFKQNRYRINHHQAGPTRDFGAGVVYQGFLVNNNFGVCTVQDSTIVCPAGGLTSRVNALIGAGQAPAGITNAITNTGLTSAQISTNPFLIRSTTSVSHSISDTKGNFIRTNVESFYIQDDFRFTKDMQFNVGLRWDYQQLYGAESSYLKLNSFKNNLQPRLGLIWDFTGNGKGKLFVNYARFLEAPIPVSLNLFAGGGNVALNLGALVNRLNAPAGSTVTVDFGGCCGANTPVDSDLKPQTVNETTAGIEYEVVKDLVLGFRGVYRAQGTVIEDGSFDEALTYFLFNPGESETERLACASEFGCFGRARRYYRALEITATKRFATNYQFIASYVYSSLIGNYEGLFVNDRGTDFPHFTELFDLQSLLVNQYGRLPNDRPHQLKFDGSYRTPWKVLVSGSFRAQSGIPFNALIPHPIYGNDNGFGVPRGTAINPVTGRNRTPTTYNLDLGAYYPIELGESRQLRIQVDWFNVFNSQRAVRQDETVRIDSGIPGVDSIQFPNTFYGQGTIFQYPSSLRLGIKFQF